MESSPSETLFKTLALDIFLPYPPFESGRSVLKQESVSVKVRRGIAMTGPQSQEKAITGTEILSSVIMYLTRAPQRDI